MLITEAEKLGIENASTLRDRNIFCNIKETSRKIEEITGGGVLQLPRWFFFKS